MGGLPASILEGVTTHERQAGEDWWARLTDAARAELALLFDPRADCCAFVLFGEGRDSWHWKANDVLVDSELLADSPELDVDWDGDYFEYRLINPERFPLPSPH